MDEYVSVGLRDDYEEVCEQFNASTAKVLYLAVSITHKSLECLCSNKREESFEKAIYKYIRRKDWGYYDEFNKPTHFVSKNFLISAYRDCPVTVDFTDFAYIVTNYALPIIELMLKDEFSEIRFKAPLIECLQMLRKIQLDKD